MIRPADRAAMVLYGSVGPELTAFAVDVDRAVLTRRGTVTLPADVQCACADAAGRHLYVVSSDGGPGRGVGTTHRADAFRVDPGSGALTPHGESHRLPSRPVHCSLDAT